MLSLECRVSIDLFGALARIAGGPSVDLPLRTGTSIGDALASLAARRPDLAALLPGCAVAIGDAVVPRHHTLFGGERLALLPPVSGG